MCRHFESLVRWSVARPARHRTEPRHGPTGEEGRQIHLAHDVGDCAALEASVTDDFCKVRDVGAERSMSGAAAAREMADALRKTPA